MSYGTIKKIFPAPYANTYSNTFGKEMRRIKMKNSSLIP